MSKEETSVIDIYPRIEPHEHGTLEVDGGDLIYWEQAVIQRGNRPSSCTAPCVWLFAMASTTL